MEAAFAIVGLFALGLFGIAAALLGRWLLGPVNRAAGRLNAPTQFQLTDFIWLMIQLQLLLAGGVRLVGDGLPPRGLLVLMTILSLPVIVLWAASVSVVSRAGITQPLRRAVLILVLVPGSLAIILAAPSLAVALFISAVNQPLIYESGNLTDDAWRLLVIQGCLVVCFVAFAFAVRRLSFWVLAPVVGK